MKKNYTTPLLLLSFVSLTIVVQAQDPCSNYYYPDTDGDGYGSYVPFLACEEPAGYVTLDLATDCDDTNPTIYVSATELCDGLDNNCNGILDDGLVGVEFYSDGDNDGFGSQDIVVACVQPPFAASNNLDCNNSDATVNPNATEVCNSIDDNCDGSTDEGFDIVTAYPDYDLDGFGSSGFTVQTCIDQPYIALVAGDCSDNNPDVNPIAPEVCDGLDNNCNGAADEGFNPTTYYADIDNDGYGNDLFNMTYACEPLPGYLTIGGDCNDFDSSISPSGTEICDGYDNNCDGTTNEGFETQTYYYDGDLDGYGQISDGLAFCMALGNYSLSTGDCEDWNPDVNPGIIEVCDNFDNNCNDDVDEGVPTFPYYFDEDNDGFGSDPDFFSCEILEFVTIDGDCDDWNPDVNPSITEVCDNSDNNCDNNTDEGFPTFAYYYDFDNDGFGSDPDFFSCEILGLVTIGGDCDDNDSFINPNAIEAFNGVDDDCDNETDEGFVSASNDPTAQKSFSVSPNPATTEVRVYLPISNVAATATITDAMGRLLYIGTLRDNKDAISVATLEPGIYFIQLQQGDKRFTERLIKL